MVAAQWAVCAGDRRIDASQTQGVCVDAKLAIPGAARVGQSQVVRICSHALPQGRSDGTRGRGAVLMLWTRFVDASATSKREIDHSWAELGAHIAESGPYPAKSVCPWLKLARFGDARTDKGSYRHNANLVSVTGVEIDYDAEAISPAEAISRLEKHGVRALVYTSPSHTPDKPRWRVLAPLHHPVAADERAALVARLNGALGNVATPESFTASQAYFYGRVQGQQEYIVRYTFDDPEEGSCIDDLQELDAIAIRPLVTSVPVRTDEGFEQITRRLGRKLRTKDGRRELLKTYIGDKSKRGLAPAEIETLVADVIQRHFDPDDPVDVSNVKEIINDFTRHDSEKRLQAEQIVGDFLRNEETLEEGKIRRVKTNFGTLKPTKWVITDFVGAGQMIVWAGQPGVGKSTVFAAVGMCIAGFGSDIGSELMIDRPRRVLIVSEHPEQYERIFFAFIKRFSLDANAVAQQILLFDAARLQRYEIIKEVSRVIEQGQGDEPPLLILDTASASFELLDENNNAEVAGYAQELKKLVIAYECPLWIIAHAAKALGREDSEITPRGASAWIGDAHGTGSVFRDPHFPNSVFIKSLKNRHERVFSEIEVDTEVLTFEVVDERGVIQKSRIRVGVPHPSDEGVRLEARKEAQDAEKQAKRTQATAELKKSLVEAFDGLGGQMMTIAQFVSHCQGRMTTKRADLFAGVDALVAEGVLVYLERPPEMITHHKQTHYLAKNQE